MDLKLKPISRSGVAEAISKAMLYRNLNEPGEAESICRDILDIDPDNQVAIRVLGLAITDQFTGTPADRWAEAEQNFLKLNDRYERLYYSGILYERRAKAQLRAGRSPHTLLVLFEHAMHCFEEAEKCRPEGNDDPILRWNRCVRLLESLGEHLTQEELEAFEAHDSPPV